LGLPGKYGMSSGITKRVIYDAEGSVIRELHLEDPNDIFSVHAYTTVQDVDPVLRSVQQAKDAGQGEGKNFRLAARIPVAFIEQMMRDGSLHDPKAMKRFLNGAEGRPWRVWEGKL
jgi:hypothetical protein